MKITKVTIVIIALLCNMIYASAQYYCPTPVASQTSFCSSLVQFTTTTSGTSYQWMENGTNLSNNSTYSGVTTQTLTINNAGSLAGKSYMVIVVVPNCGGKASNNVTLTITPPPAIALQPSNQTVCEGRASSFTISAAGATSYYWTWNGNGPLTDGGMPWSGSFSTTLSIASTAASLAGQYRAVAVNSCGSATSNPATLTVDQPISVSNNSPVCELTTLTLNGPNGLTAYSWTGPNGFSSNEQSPTVSASTTSAMAGVYSLTVSPGNSCGNTASTTTIVNPLPSVYTITGSVGPPYCSKSSPDIGLDGSQTGVNYQMYNGSTKVGSAITGTGSTLNLGSTLEGTYTIIATNATSQCSNTMNGSITVGTSPLIYTITSSGSTPYCSNGNGATVGIGGSQTGINYQLYNGSTALGSAISGTGSAISFGNLTAAGTYTVKAINPLSECTSSMSGSVLINATPNSYTITSTGTPPYCSSTGTTIGLDGSQAGVNYTVFSDGTSLNSITGTGTGSAISFGNQTLAGNYWVLVSPSYGCNITIHNINSIIINASPTVYNITGGGGYCIGGPGVPIGLSGSQTETNYQLYNGSATVGSIMAGTGSALNFGNQTAEGTYTIKATSSNTCSMSMNGSATVTINPLPSVYTITGSIGPPYCSKSSPAIGLDGSQTGVNYQMYNGSTKVGSAIAGTGSTLNLGSTLEGTYTIIATNATSQCSNIMNGSITVSTSPLIYTITSSGSTPYCSNGNGATIGIGGSQTGINYQLYNGSITVGSAISGSGSAISFGNLKAAGTYTAKATDPLSGCISNVSGSVLISATPNSYTITGTGTPPYCSSTGTTIGLDGSQAGVNYVLYNGGTSLNSVTGNGSAITFGKQTALGQYWVLVVPSYGCNTTIYGLTLGTLPAIIKQPFNLTQCFGSNATFSVRATDIGLVYQWRKNGINITNATDSSFTINNAQASDIANYDVVVSYGIGGCSVTSIQAALVLTLFKDQPDKNYVISKNILQDGIYTENDIIPLQVESLQESISYFDGLGRPLQQVTLQGSPSKHDIVQSITYDEFGRETKKYLPYTGGSDGWFKDNAFTDQATFYKTTGNVANDDSAYSRSVLENSPLNRIFEQGSPGKDWQPGTNHTIKFGYLSNGADEVKIWQITNDTVCEQNGNYDFAQLYATQTTDENGHSTMEYKDKEGHVILKKTFNGSDSLQTYYVYDDYGLLRYVIPPKAAASIRVTTLNPSDNLVKQLCYYYQYDYRHRMIVKQIPGAERVYMVYDNRDRLVATQDGNMRKNNQWMFTKYDALNRPVMTGIKQITDNLDNIRTQAMASSSFEQRISTGIVGYTLNQTYPVVTENDLLTITYYDDYTYSDPLAFVAELDNTANNVAVKGQITGSKVRILGDNTHWFTTTNYYDDKYRVIQTIKQNNIGGTDRVTNTYDFVGKILQSYYTHTGTKGVTIAKRFEYDHAGRLIKIFHKIDTGPEILMSYMQYNELGQLIDKKIHSSDVAQVKYLQSIDYRYNIRGWLTHINNANLGNAPTDATQDDLTNEKPDAFGMELRYNDPF